VHAVALIIPGLPNSDLQSQIDSFASFNCVLEGNVGSLLADSFSQRSLQPDVEFQAITVTSTDHVCIESEGWLDISLSSASHAQTGLQATRIDSAAGSLGSVEVCISASIRITK
jgi:hypothetical protein